MTVLGWRLAALALLLGLAVGGLGTACGVWQAARHYQPLLDKANREQAACLSARGNLEELGKEQGLKLGALVLVGNERQARAEQAMRDGQTTTQADYAAANRLQQERSGGDQCAAAASIIDKELGL